MLLGRFVKKIIASIVVMCFSFTFVFRQPLQAAVENYKDTSALKKVSLGVNIPTSLGRITDACFFNGSDDPGKESIKHNKVIINIQDLHCHPEVQRNINKILTALGKDLNIEGLFIEGASGKINDSWITSINDDAKRKEILDALIEYGKISGSEYYAVNNNKIGISYGLENRSEYLKNIVRLNKISDKQDDYEAQLSQYQDEIEKLRSRYLNAKQKKLEKISNKYASGEIKSDKYHDILVNYADEYKISIGEYKNFSTFLKLKEYEKDLNYKQVAKELQEYLKYLKETLPFSVYSKIMAATNNTSDLEGLYAKLI